MSEEPFRTTRDPRAEHPCPACGQPRQVVARRHKVLGAWVPEWEVQPCRNPECELYEPGEEGPAQTLPEAAPGSSPEASAPAASEVAAEAATPHVTGKNGETGRSPAAG
ncbi:hypothetical protein [Streptomyces sp. NPDC004267]|uniref:hypothetical protein n=1 Tax=Streptomyces sp. NPDC004267 TaxID=3364694 RepID=UPI003692F93D